MVALANRVEGSPATTVMLDDGRHDPLSPLIESVHGLYRLAQRAAVLELGPAADGGDENEDDDQ